MATPRDIEDIDEKDERQMHAEAEADGQGIDKKQVPEMVDAEIEGEKPAKEEKKN